MPPCAVKPASVWLVAHGGIYVFMCVVHSVKLASAIIASAKRAIYLVV